MSTKNTIDNKFVETYYHDFGISNDKNVNLELQNLYKKQKESKKDMPHFSTDVAPNFYQQADLLFLPEDDEYKYLLVVVDQATRKIDCMALKSKDNKTVLLGLKQIYKNDILKKPRVMTTDNGNEFEGVVNKYFEDNNIEHKKGIPGRHRQTALVEAANNKIVKAIFRRQTAYELIKGEQYKKWVEFLPTIIESINKRAEINYKKNLIENKKTKNDIEPISNKNTGDIFDIGTRVRIKLDNPIDVVTHKRLHGKFRNSDIRFTPDVHEITDIVFKPHQPVMYEIDNDNKAVYTKPQLLEVTNEIEIDANKLTKNDNEDNDVYVVSEILDEKGKGNNRELLIKWKGYKVPTWEKYKSIFNDVPEMVKQYEKNKGKK